MNNYMNISDDAHSLLFEIAYNKNDAPALKFCQLEKLGEHAGLHANYALLAQEFKKYGIAKISSSGKELYPDSTHLEEFRSKFPAEQSV